MKIGMQELLIVFIVALVVLGPDKMPLYARRFGEALKAFRKYSSEATKDIRESVVEPLQEAQKPLREAMEPITDLKKEVDSNVRDLRKSFTDIGRSSEAKQPQTEQAAGSEAEETAEVSESAQAADTAEEMQNAGAADSAQSVNVDETANTAAENTEDI